MNLVRIALVYLRSIALLSLAAMSGMVGLVGLFSKPVKAQVPVAVVNPFEYEHRVTALEVSVKVIADAQAQLVSQLKDVQTTKWLELVALSGLLGETGLRAFRQILTGSKDD